MFVNADMNACHPLKRTIIALPEKEGKDFNFYTNCSQYAVLTAYRRNTRKRSNGCT